MFGGGPRVAARFATRHEPPPWAMVLQPLRGRRNMIRPDWRHLHCAECQCKASTSVSRECGTVSGYRVIGWFADGMGTACKACGRVDNPDRDPVSLRRSPTTLSVTRRAAGVRRDRHVWAEPPHL